MTTAEKIAQMRTWIGEIAQEKKVDIILSFDDNGEIVTTAACTLDFLIHAAEAYATKAKKEFNAHTNKNIN